MAPSAPTWFHGTAGVLMKVMILACGGAEYSVTVDALSGRSEVCVEREPLEGTGCPTRGNTFIRGGFSPHLFWELQ